MTPCPAFKRLEQIRPLGGENVDFSSGRDSLSHNPALQCRATGSLFSGEKSGKTICLTLK
jgi:hypothetical protein